MRKKTDKKIQPPAAGITQLLGAAGVLLALLAFVALAGLGMYQAVSRAALQTTRQTMLDIAGHDRTAVEAVFAQREKALERWAYSLRSTGFTDSAEVLRTVAQDCSLLGAGGLYLVDDDFLYYGSNGETEQLSQYDAMLEGMSGDAQTQNRGGQMLVYVRIRPFTVDGSTFRWAVASYDPSDYLEDLTRTLVTGKQGAEIIDTEGASIARIGMDNGLFSVVESIQADGYATPADLRQRILTADSLYTACRISSDNFILLSGGLPDRGWILLTLDTAPKPTSLYSPMMALYLAVVVLLAAAVWRLRGFRLRERGLRRQAGEARERCDRLQVSLDTALENNRSQQVVLNTISHNIRTPLNSIVGFTALATRHFQESEVVREHLAKVGDASAQLLSKLNEGLDATGWHRYVEEEAQPPAGTKAVDLSGRRILLVEDNALNRDIGEAVLSEIGMLVECAENGEQGFQRVATSRPGYYDLVLMDIQMPVMDGYEATRMIRRLRSKLLAEIPILAMTANVSVEDKRKAFEAGMDGYVEKPMNIDRLLTAIQNALGQTYAG